MAADIPSRYRSAAEYCFDEEQADAIIKTVASSRSDFRLTVVSFPPDEHDNVRQSIATPFRRAPENDASTGLGNLARLPPKLLHEVLPRMDMASLFALWQANLSSRRAVDSLPQYQRVTSHGLDVLCALLRTRLAAHVSLLDFYDVLCTKGCAVCGRKLAEFVSLLAWGRCCFTCLHKGVPEVRVQALASAQRQFGLTAAEAGQLRSFKTLPGTYSMDETEDNARTTVVSALQVEMLPKSHPRQQPSPPDDPAEMVTVRVGRSSGILIVLVIVSSGAEIEVNYTVLPAEGEEPNVQTPLRREAGERRPSGPCGRRRGLILLAKIHVVIEQRRRPALRSLAYAS